MRAETLTLLLTVVFPVLRRVPGMNQHPRKLSFILQKKLRLKELIQ